jgi:hypothetical protein
MAMSKVRLQNQQQTGQAPRVERNLIAIKTYLICFIALHFACQYSTSGCAKRVKNLDAALRRNDLTVEQQANIEEDLNQKFRGWLVTSGISRQVLDLVLMESDQSLREERYMRSVGLAHLFIVQNFSILLMS